MYAACKSLPKELKDRIRGLTNKHGTQYTLDGLARNERKPSWKAKADGSFDVVTLPGTSHPIARMHPETLRHALYLGRRQNTYINELPLNDPEALLDALWALTDAMEQSIFHHRWRVGDLLIWDSRCVMHRRYAFPPTTRHIMHRTQI